MHEKRKIKWNVWLIRLCSGKRAAIHVSRLVIQLFSPVPVCWSICVNRKFLTNPNQFVSFPRLTKKYKGDVVATFLIPRNIQAASKTTSGEGLYVPGRQICNASQVCASRSLSPSLILNCYLPSCSIHGDWYQRACEPGRGASLSCYVVVLSLEPALTPPSLSHHCTALPCTAYCFFPTAGRGTTPCWSGCRPFRSKRKFQVSHTLLTCLFSLLLAICVCFVGLKRKLQALQKGMIAAPNGVYPFMFSVWL